MNDYPICEGTVRRYIGGDGTTIIGIERTVQAPLGNLAPAPQPNAVAHDRRTHFLTCEPALAKDLLSRYGVQEGTWTSMEAIIGAPCRYVESATGMLVRLDILLN